MMLGDRRYALETLACAHTMNDAMLRELAMELFRHFESVQSGRAPRQHPASQLTLRSLGGHGPAPAPPR